MELTEEHIKTLRQAAEVDSREPEGKGWILMSPEVVLALCYLTISKQVPFVSEELVRAKGPAGTL